MKKMIICNVPMKSGQSVAQKSYACRVKGMKVATDPVRFPINAFLAENLDSDCEIKIVLLVKNAKHSCSRTNVELFKKEFEEVVGNKRFSTEYVLLETDFSQEASIHEELMGKIVAEIESGMHIIADVTYGPKDLPIVVFSALAFAEKFLACEIDEIVYGQAEFHNGQVVDTKICSMKSLFYLSSITNTIQATSPDRARKMLESLLSV